MDPLLPNVPRLARFRLSRITPLLLCVSLLSSTSVQGSDGPMWSDVGGALCQPKQCPSQASAFGLLPVGELERGHLALASHQPSSGREWAAEGRRAWSTHKQPGSGLSPAPQQAPDPDDSLIASAWLEPCREPALVGGWLARDSGSPSRQPINGAAYGWAIKDKTKREGLERSSSPDVSLDRPTPHLDPQPPAALPPLPADLDRDRDRDPAPQSVPGPLPVLGLITALGYCRQIRLAIKLRPRRTGHQDLP
jgi:hypothetical protein